MTQINISQPLSVVYTTSIKFVILLCEGKIDQGKVLY